MAKHGAKNIILASRSGKSQSDTMEMVQRLSVEDVRVKVCECDMASAAEVGHLFGECRKSLPPIRGIIHGAYVNKVRLTLNLRWPHNQYSRTDTNAPRTSSSKSPPSPIGTLS